MSILLNALIERYGFSLSLPQAAEALSYTNHKAVRSAINRGTFPIPLRKAGGKVLVSAADVAAFLAGELPASAAAKPPAPEKPTTSKTKKSNAGRRSNAAKAAAAAAGKGGEL